MPLEVNSRQVLVVELGQSLPDDGDVFHVLRKLGRLLLRSELDLPLLFGDVGSQGGRGVFERSSLR